MRDNIYENANVHDPRPPWKEVIEKELLLIDDPYSMIDAVWDLQITVRFIGLWIKIYGDCYCVAYSVLIYISNHNVI